MKIGRFAALAILGILLAINIILRDVPASAQTVPDVLRARAIELVDARGRVRAQFNVQSTGEVVLRLRDSTGTIRVKLGADEDGSGLLLANESTEPGVHILATRDRTLLSVQRGERKQVITP